MSQRQSLLFLNVADKHFVSKLLSHEHIVALKTTEALSSPAQETGSCMKQCQYMQFILYDKCFIAFCPLATSTLLVKSCSSMSPEKNRSSQQLHP